MTKEEINKKVIIISAAIQLTHELLDDLAETTYYKHKTKLAIKNLQKELTITADDQTCKLWNTDEKSMVAIQDGILEYAKLLKDADPIKIAALGELLKTEKELIEEL